MKNPGLLAPAAFAFFLVPSLLFAQGSVTPAGPPGPSMKALDQVEARTIIDSLPFVISAPGSFYLTKNLSVTSGNGITINSDDVSIDLNGFTISSTEAAPTGTGISITGGGIPGRANISIRNGTIRGNVTGPPPFTGSGFMHGIRPLFSSQNTRVSNVSVLGCLGDGILFSQSSNAIENCTVQSVGGVGISGDSVQNCTARLCGTGGIQGATVINSSGDCVTGFGILAGTATNCKGSVSNGSGPSNAGINATNAMNCIGEDLSSNVGIQATTARNCNASSRFGKAIVAKIVDGCFAQCFGTGTTATAIEATSVANSYGETGSGTAISATMVSNSHGKTVSGRAIIATVVSSSVGETASGVSGILATTVSNSFGNSGGTGQVFGIDATNTGVVHNSVGTATPTSPSSIGISARVTSYSRGSGHTGIAGGNVIGSFGTGNGGGPNITGQQFLPP